ncbi:MAG: nucleotide exchange factor GrpE [Clostridia bacterium]|nr:nucleotide exchange factor GrpE [Clostridia bacterium]
MSYEDRNENGQAAQGAVPTDDMAAKLSEAEAKASENWNRYLRTLADLDNFQKRTARDLAFNVRCGKKDLVLRVLEIVDDLERALASDADYTSLRHGVEVITRKLLEALACDGVKPIEALGKPFDPRFHDAVAVCEDPNLEVETIVDELRRGYTYDEDVIRPTMARVARP